jgi:hypothetical protein
LAWIEACFLEIEGGGEKSGLLGIIDDLDQHTAVLLPPSFSSWTLMTGDGALNDFSEFGVVPVSTGDNRWSNR